MGAYAVVVGGLTALWASLPALVKAYLLIATARGLLSAAAGLIARRPAREIARENFAHLIALGAILLIWFSGELLHSEMSDLAQVLVLASKLISLASSSPENQMSSIAPNAIRCAKFSRAISRMGRLANAPAATPSSPRAVASSRYA